MGWTGQTRRLMWTGQKYRTVRVKMTTFFVVKSDSSHDSCRLNSSTNLGQRDAALSGQLLLDLLGRVGVGQVGVEVLVQHLGRLLAVVPPLPPRVQEPGPQDHDRLAGALGGCHGVAIQ